MVLEMMLEWVDILLSTVVDGARYLRLDAYAYCFKQEGTQCINLPQTKILLQLFQEALRLANGDQVAILPSITNVR